MEESGVGACAGTPLATADGFWSDLEAHLEAHTDAAVSHGICPRCAEDMTAGPE